MSNFRCLAVIAIATIGFFYHRGFHYAINFRGHKYDEREFLRWSIANLVFDRKGSAIALGAAIASYYWSDRAPNVTLVIAAIAALALAAVMFIERDRQDAGKLDWQSCSRLKAIRLVAVALYALLTIFTLFGFNATELKIPIYAYWLLVIILIQSSPLWILLANRFASNIRQSS